MEETARIMAGIPEKNLTLYHRVRFLVGDPTAYVELPGAANGENSGVSSVFIVRDIEMKRARKHAQADRIACPADYTPQDGLSGDRETATAQAAAECLYRANITQVIADRTLPLIFAHELARAGITVTCDPQWGVEDRRVKDAEECEHLRQAQRITESAVRMACETIAGAVADSHGVLLHEGTPLTAERMMSMIDVFLLERGYANPGSIVAGGRVGGDCHHRGEGNLRSGEPVMVDIFPQNKATLYNGDCTRTVVHGRAGDRIAAMHAAVVEAKAAAIATVRAGVTGRAVHQAAVEVIARHGFASGMPPADAGDAWCGMPHGTGHGVGLAVHEPPLLDDKGPPLIAGDVVTVEPGLYCNSIGGVRIEDMVIVTEDGCENLNSLPEGLDWST